MAQLIEDRRKREEEIVAERAAREKERVARERERGQDANGSDARAHG